MKINQTVNSLRGSIKHEFQTYTCVVKITRSIIYSWYEKYTQHTREYKTTYVIAKMIFMIRNDFLFDGQFQTDM